ncbi:MAG TPA: glycosyl hydrolase family 18 protein [Acidobacteriota bacterium]|nr:glycosyl hydrolase family 18 protein [Acidobacteriota bacterium]
MSKETFIAYWSGEEPTGPEHSPTLEQTPDFVDIVILFYVLINDDGSLNFDRLVLHNDQATIMGWMEDIRQRQQNQQRKTKFTLGILSGSFPEQDPSTFAQTVAAAAEDWGVDGITVDYEPPTSDPSIINVVKAIRSALPSGSIMTAPIYGAWLGNPQLQPFAQQFDYVSTMDYTPYPGYSSTISLYNDYGQTIGGTDKLAIGVSCMTFTNGNHTPLDDVKKLCAYEPSGGNKLGIMLYTLSYDAPGHGSPYPLFTYTDTIHDSLP